jgi:hypothetical protein
MEDPALVSALVATTVTANLPIIVERSQYWPIQRRSGARRTTASV